MFVEIRKQGKKNKYYLVHSYRVVGKVKRISRYLGSNLNKKELENLKKRAEELILQQIKERYPFELSTEEIEAYKQLELEIQHLQKRLDWNQFTEDFSYNTNAIEGSIVKYEKAKKLIEKKDLPKNFDEFETINVAKAIDFVRATKEKLSVNLIKKLHFLCFDKTKSFAGKLRGVEVVIKDGAGNIVHRGAPFGKVKSLLQNLVKWYNGHEKKYPPLLLAAIAHNQFEHIHPFQDGNGRVGRLLLNYVLLKHKYPPINIRLKDRGRYYKVLRKFSEMGDINPTLRFLITQYRK